MNKLAMSFLAGMICLITLSSCGNHHQPSTKTTDTVSTAPTDTSNKNFFPVADFLRSEVGYVDSTPLAIVKYNIRDTRKDSSFIQPKEFNRLAATFLQPELESDSMAHKFTETSFMDKASGYVGFIYSPVSDAQALQRVDVLTQPNDNGINRVKSIYLVRVFKSGDTAVTQKMYWQAKHNFLIVTSLTPPGKPSITGQVKVVWDAGSEE